MMVISALGWAEVCATARHASILQEVVVPLANADPVRNHVAQYDDNDATKKTLKSVANKQAK